MGGGKLRAGDSPGSPELDGRSARISRRFDELGSDGCASRLGIMGGTFDPIHSGHLRIAEEVREALELDAVLFVPAGAPVFKRDRRITDAEVRFRQVSEAVAGNPRFDASRIEIDRAGDTFTVDTLRELRAFYPDNVELVLIVGADVAETIGKWRGCAEIARLARLAVALGRPGCLERERLSALVESAGPFAYDMVDVTPLDISSRDIRARLAEGRSVRYLVPDRIERDLRAGAHAPKAAASPCDEGPDALSDEFFEARKADLSQRVGKKRFAHSLGVSDTCVQLAKRYGLEVAKARLAGLLHDWDKGLDDREARRRVVELGLADDIDPWVVENMPRVLHGTTAAVALGRAFPQIPADVLQAIDRHTTAAVDMSDLDKVLYIADALEPSRRFGRIDELRQAAETATLDELYLQTYEYWTFLLLERRSPLHPDTMRIWNANALRWQREKARRKGKKRD